MVSGNVASRALMVKTVSIILTFLLVIPGITALGTDRTAQLRADKGGDTLVVFDHATFTEFNAVVAAIEASGGNAYTRHPAYTLRAELPAGVGSSVLAMPGVHSIHTGKADVKALKALGSDVAIDATAWNLHLLREADGPHSAATTGSHLGVATGPVIHDGMAEISNDAIVCDANDVCTNDLAAAKEYVKDMRTRPMDGVALAPPYPGLWDTSEFLLGTIGVAIVFPESNGSIDANQEDWTGAEETNVVNEITGAFTWWQNRKTAQGINVPLTFTYKTYYKQATSYEPITRNGFSGAANQNMWTWMNEIQGNLGYNNGQNGAREFANATRYQLGTDWGYIIWVADDTVDGNNQFADNTFGFASLGGPYVVMTYDNDGYTITGMDSVTAHETGHIFFGLDEYSGSGADSGDRSGYENVLNGNAVDVGSPAPLSNVGCIMRGGTGPFSGNQICGFTKGQHGWNDTDADNIPNVVDTFPNSTLDSMPNHLTNKTAYTYYGNVTEVAADNRNPWGAGNDVTINKISSVQWRIDSGGWTAATALDGAFSNQTEKFSFALSGLAEGQHFVEVRATNNRGNVEPQFANDTFLVDLTKPTTSVDPLAPYYTANSFKVNWTGSDGAGSGVKNVELYYSKDGGAWTRYQTKFATKSIVFNHLGDGKYDFYTIGFDNASNVELAPLTADATTIVEGTPPTSSAGPLPTYTNQSAFDLPWQAEDLGIGVDYIQLYFRCNMSMWFFLGNYTSSPISLPPTTDGRYDFYTIALDKLGNIETKTPTAEASITVDTLTPVTSITRVGTTGDNGWYISKVAVTLFTSEAAKDLNYTRYRLDGGNWTDYDKTFYVQADGVHTIEYYSADLAGNVELVKTITIKVDLTVPTGTVLIDKGNVQTNDTSIDVDITASDSAAPVTQMMVTEDPSFAAAQWENLTGHLVMTVTSVAGEKFVYAQFKNEAGLVSEVVSDTIIIDADGPTIKITKPADKAALASYQFVVEGTANDNVGIAKVEVSMDGENWTLANGTTKWDSIISVPKDGTYDIFARTYDKVGNSASAQISVEVDASLPTLDLDTPKDSTVSESKTIPVTGQTDPKAVVKVNGAAVTVNADGTFSTLVSLKDGTNTVIITIQKPAGTIEKRIRVIYVHPPIIISDLKHDPVEPAPGDNVTITCTVPGAHIRRVELKWKIFGKAEETANMTKGAKDEYRTVIGPFADGDNVEYFVQATDDVGTKARSPETTKKNFTVEGPYIPVLPPTKKTEDNSIYAILFLLILFVLFAVAIGLMMRTPKNPYAAKKVSGRTAVERVDDRIEDGGSEGSKFRGESGPRERYPDDGGSGGYDDSAPTESDKYDTGDGYTRYKDDKY